LLTGAESRKTRRKCETLDSLREISVNSSGLMEEVCSNRKQYAGSFSESRADQVIFVSEIVEPIVRIEPALRQLFT
jgi:hypothetical protein